MPITIRTATAADAEHIAPLFDAYRSFFAAHSDPALSLRFLRERLERGESVVLVALDDTTVTGFLQLYPLFSSWYCRRQWFLSDLFVTPEYRGRGIGALLVRACIAVAEQTQARAVLVELPHSEPHLTSFYGKLGFSKDALFDLYRNVLGR